MNMLAKSTDMFAIGENSCVESLTDLLNEMERERDETESTECDLSDDGNENSLFSLSQLSLEKDADTNIGSTIQTEDLPSLSQSFERCNHMDNFRKSQGLHMDSTETSRPKNPQGRKRVVRFASIPKLATTSS